MSARRRRAPRTGLGLLRNASDDDPLAGVANLFDTGIVFALGFLVSLVNAMHLLSLFDQKATVTIATERPDGLEVTVKRGRETTVRRLTNKAGSGNGVRLGTAYRLADGTVVYVPEDEAPAATEGGATAPEKK